MANPLNVALCPLTALGMYFLQHGMLLVNNDNTVLFPGGPRSFFPLLSLKLPPKGNQESRFSKEVARQLSSREGLEALAAVGRELDEIGAHSTRKGAGTYASSGTTVPPMWIAICIRGGWAYGSVPERYIKWNLAQDRYIARLLAGLNVLDADFAVLPPHFPPGSLLAGDLERCFPGLTQMTSLRALLTFCLASVVHHREQLLELLPSSHGLRFTAPFTDNAFYNRLKAAVVVGPSPMLKKPSGLPPHVVMLGKFDLLQRGIAALKETIGEDLILRLRAEGAAASQITPDTIGQHVRASVAASVKDIMAPYLPGIEAAAAVAAATTGAAASERTNPEAMQAFTRHYGFSFFPPSFVELPSCSLLQGWHLWLAGNPAEGWPPLRLLCPDDFRKGSSGRKRLSDWKYLMDQLAVGVDVKALRPIEAAVERQVALVKALESWPEAPRLKSTRPNDWMLLTAVKELRLGSKADVPRAKRARRSSSHLATAVDLDEEEIIDEGPTTAPAPVPIPAQPAPPQEDAMDLDG